jgi:NAD(P)-dependent dehydrogenase (short-subunit alcohol dehydrogenase family)
MSVAGKTVVITGASRGIGKGLADYFAAQGAKLGLCARSLSDSSSESIVTASVDVTDGAAVNKFGEQVVEALGSIDLWINNAGLLEPIAPLRDVDVDQFRRHIDVNVTGVLNGSRFYINHVRKCGHAGVLINISSNAGHNGYAGWSAYCAGKAAVNLLSECIKLEEKDIDLRVHAVAPGIVDTDMQALIRECSPELFPSVDKFLELKRTDSFSSTDFVAKKLLELIFDPKARTDDVFVAFPLESD